MKPRIKLKHTTPEQMLEQIAVRPDFGGFGGWLPNPDPILRKMGRHIEVYRELLRDPLVGGQVRRRKAAVLRLQWRLDGDAPEHIKEAVSSALEALGIEDLIKDTLNAPLFGYQPIEIVWQAQGGQWLPVQAISKPQEWFAFDEAGAMYFVHYRQNGVYNEPLPPYKFLCPRHEAGYLNPYGLGDLGLVFWAVTFKRAGLKFWAEFTQKYGSPWLIGKEPRSNTQADTDKLLDALEALVGNAVGTIPNDSSVEIHEASGKASSVDAFEKLIRYCRSEINIALLGQDQTTEKDTNHASASAGLEVVQEIRDADCRIAEAAVNQLIDWFCELNFGNTPRPQFVLHEEEQYGSLELAQRDQVLHQIGARFSPDYFKRAYGLQDEDFTLAQPNQSTDEEAHESNDFAEAEQRADLADKLAVLMPPDQELNQQAQSIWQAINGKLPDNLHDEQQLLEILAAAYPDLPLEELQDKLSQMLFVSAVLGRINTERALV